MKKRILSMVLILGVLVCALSMTVLAEESSVDAFSLTCHDQTGYIGEEAEYYHLNQAVISYSFQPEETSEMVTMVSDNPDVATVEYDGEHDSWYAHYHKLGTAVITATTESGLTDTCTITVKEIESVQINQPFTVTIQPNDEVHYQFEVDKSETYYSLYSENGEGLLRIDQGRPPFYGTGVDTQLLYVGTYVLTAYNKTDEPKTYTLCIKESVPAEKFVFEQDVYYGYPGDEVLTKGELYPVWHIPENAVLSSSDKNIAYYSGTYWVTLANPGTATITATTSGGGTTQCTVIVRDYEPIQLGESKTITLPLRDEKRFTFTPEKDGEYYFYTPMEENDSVGNFRYFDLYIHCDGKFVSENVSMPGYEAVSCVMEAGKTYILSARYSLLGDSEFTGTVIVDTQLPGRDPSGIRTDEYGQIFFDTFEQLVELSQKAYDELTFIFYDGSEPLIIERNLILSENINFNTYHQTEVIVPKDITFEIHGGSIDKLTVYGIFKCNHLKVDGRIDIKGQFYVISELDLFTWEANGLDNIIYETPEASLVWCNNYAIFSQAEEMIEKAVVATDERWSYWILVYEPVPIELKDNVIVPENMHMAIYSENDGDITFNITETGSLAVEGTMGIFVPVSVQGDLINSGRITFGNHEYYGYGTLHIAESGKYSGDGEIWVDRSDKQDLQSILSGLNLDAFVISEVESFNGYSWKLVKRTSPIDCNGTHTWNAGEETTAPTCTTDGTKAFTCTVCGETKIETLPAIGHSYTDGKCTVCGVADPDYAAPTPTPTPTPDVPDTAETPFTDVADADYFYRPVLWAVDNNITGGLGEGIFGPNEGCTRGQVVTFLWAANGKPEPKSMDNPFDDVAENAWYLKPVLWAVENGITGGTSATTFGPEQTCTRGQIVTFLWAANGKPAVEGESSFTDVTASDWFLNPVLWAAENNVTGGIGDGMFGPNNTCTRGQVVTFLYKVYNK